MKTIHSLRRLILAAVLPTSNLILGVSTVHADMIAFATTPVSPTNGPLATYGYSFMLASPERITQLGYYDPYSVGNLNVQVNLWDSTGSFLGGTVVTGPVSGEISGYLYTALSTPLTLGAGTYVIGGYGYPVFQTQPPTGSASGVTYNGARFGNGAVYPATPEVSFGYFGPNFQFVVPEPSTWALLGSGVFGLGLVTLRRRTA